MDAGFKGGAPRRPARGFRPGAVAIGLVAGLAARPAPASAHVKWFAAYDVAAAPAPLDGVLTTQFLLVLGGFTLLVFAGFVLDRLAARHWLRGTGPAGRPMGEPTGRPTGREEIEDRLLRAGFGAFFVALFAMGGVILTPELRTGAGWPSWLQLGIAASMLSARSCVLGGIGILVLYGYGVALYGVFHLTDYPLFLGIAAWLALTSCRAARLRAARLPVLCASLCASLMWAAVEKWAYPQWTLPLLAERPYLTLGIPPREFMVLAGFVEFALAFHILTGLGLLRLGIGGLGLIFLAAIADFGRLDAIGHLPILVTLAALFLHGPTALHHRLHDAGRGLLAEARRAGLGFAAALALFFAGYYGLQHAEYAQGAGHWAGLGAGPGPHRTAALAAPAR